MREFCAFLLLLPAACVGPARVIPAPPPPAAVVALPPAPPAPVGTDWRDWPMSSGTWRYSRGADASVASYGARADPPILMVRCRFGERLVTLELSQGAVAPTAISVTTSSLTKSLPVATDPAGRAIATLSARDALLDAMSFSRGRFVITATNAAPLVVPAWAELVRVVEDCRS